MKLVIIFVLFANSLFSQTHDFFIGTNFGLERTASFQTTYEYKLDFLIMQYTFLSERDDIFFNFKTGFGKDHGDIAWYIYLPYLNFNFNEKAYNTPFSAEVFYNNISLCADIYYGSKFQVVPILKARVPIKVKNGKTKKIRDGE